MKFKIDRNSLKKKTIAGIVGLVGIGITILAMYYLKNEDSESEEEINYDNNCNYEGDDYCHDIDDNDENQSEYEDGQGYYYSEDDEEWIEADYIRHFPTHSYSEECNEMIEKENDFDGYNQEDLDSLSENMWNKYN